jgi:hypothetical protein
MGKNSSEIVVRIAIIDMVGFMVIFHLTFWPIFFRIAGF